VLSEFTGAWHELHQAFACNPHDIEGLKQTILRAINTPAKDKQRIMKALRRRVSDHDVQRWAARYLAALAAAPDLPHAEPRNPPTPHAVTTPLMPAPDEARATSSGSRS